MLEQLVGSQSLAAAVECAISIRNLTFLGTGILLLWALSPLGGQSSLRVLDMRQRSTFGKQLVYYFDVNDTSESTFMGASAMASASAAMTAIYEACLLAPEKVQSSATDLWSNPKLPFLESIPGYDGNSAPDKWLKVQDASNVTYSSLTGVMVTGLPPDRSSNFSIQSSYFNLRCSDGAYFAINSSVNMTEDLNGYYSGFIDWLGVLGYYVNITEGLFMSGSTWNSFMVDTNWDLNDFTAPNPDSINLIYASQGDGPASQIAAYNCTIEMSRVEAGIACDQTACRVDRMRRSLIDTRSPYSTPFNEGHNHYFAFFLSWFPLAAGAMHDGVMSPTDLYIAGSNSPYNSQEQVNSPFANVTGKQVSQRLSTLLNTAWQASLATTSIAEAPTGLAAIAVSDGGYTSANTTADTFLSTPVYVADKVWVSLTAATSITLLLCGIAGMVLKYVAKVPDILGYVSTMTRENLYFEDPVGGDAMDGLERARVLKHVQVQIVDVKPWDKRGYIAFRRARSE